MARTWPGFDDRIGPCKAPERAHSVGLPLTLRRSAKGRRGQPAAFWLSGAGPKCCGGGFPGHRANRLKRPANAMGLAPVPAPVRPDRVAIRRSVWDRHIGRDRSRPELRCERHSAEESRNYGTRRPDITRSAEWLPPPAASAGRARRALGARNQRLGRRNQRHNCMHCERGAWHHGGRPRDAAPDGCLHQVPCDNDLQPGRAEALRDAGAVGIGRGERQDQHGVPAGALLDEHALLEAMQVRRARRALHVAGEAAQGMYRRRNILFPPTTLTPLPKMKLTLTPGIFENCSLPQAHQATLKSESGG